MLTPGTILKNERVKQNLTLDQVSAATEIQKHYLESLESDDYAKFPSTVYTRGFLQNYSKFLNVNTNRILALYRRTVGEVPPGQIKNAQTPLKTPKFVITPSLIIITTVVLIIAATLGYLIYQFYNFQKPPNLEIYSPSGNITVEQPDITVKGKTDPGMFLTINDEPVTIDSEGKFEAKITLSKGNNSIVIKSRHPDNVGKEAVITRTVKYETAEEIIETEGADSSGASEGTVEGATDTPQQTENDTSDNSDSPFRVTVTITTDNSWVEIEIDGHQETANILTPGTILEFTPEQSFYIMSGKVSSTQITINDQPQTFFIDEGGIGTLLCEFENNIVDCHQP